MASKFTAKDVAQHMLSVFRSAGELAQEDAVYEIEAKFGSDFVYENDNGNPAISKAVLNEFRKISPDAVWERGMKLWRQRYDYDDPNSRGQY